MHEVNLVRLRSMPSLENARALDELFRELDDEYRSGFVARGRIAIEMQDRELWRELKDLEGNPYRSFEHWVCAAAPHSRRDVFYSMKACRELVGDIPMEQLQEIPRCNIALLQSLSSEVRTNPEVIDAAKALPEKEFRAKVIQDHPLQHIESKHRIVLMYSESDYRALMEAVEAYGYAMGVNDLAGQILGVIIDWQQERK